MGARGRRHVLAAVAVALTVGCAARVGPVQWAVGDAAVTSCPEGSACCSEVTRGGTLSEGFDVLVERTLGRAIDAVACFFHSCPPPPTAEK